MSRIVWSGLLSAALGLFLAVPQAPASEPSESKTYAVLIGVSEFGDKAIKTRTHAETDVKAIYDVLVDPKYLGVPGADVRLLLGAKDEKRNSEPATRENILKAFKWVSEKAGKNDQVFVVMVGQGGPMGKDRTVFFASDSTFKERDKNAVAAPEIEQAIEKLKSEKFVALLDINYKGFDAGTNSVIEPSPFDLLKTFVGNEDKEEHTLPQGRVVFFANAGIQPSLDLENGGLFAKVVVDALKGAADTDGYEPDGLVTVDELDVYLEKEVSKLAREFGKNKEEKQQLTFDWGARANHFVLTKNPTITPKVEERLAKLKALTLAADVSKEGEKLLARMPKLNADQELRKLFVKVSEGTMTPEQFLTERKANYDGRQLSRDDARRFATRVMDGLGVVKSQYVKELNRGEMVGWAIRGLYRRLDEKMPAEIKTRLEGVKELSTQKLDEFLADVRVALGKREDLEGNKDVDMALAMMMSNLDFPYSTYIDKETKDKADIDFRGQFTGIGIQIRRDLARDGLLVVTPIKGSPAYKAGLKTGDLVTEITSNRDSKGVKLAQPESITTKSMKTEEAVKRILGEAGTKVKVKVEREGASQPLEFELTRGRVEVETVLGAKRLEDDSWDFMIDPDSKIGYIRLTQFAPRSSQDMEAALKKLKKLGLKGLVLDLRFNPGGLLTSAVEISDMFIDDGLIVTIKPRVGQEQNYGGQLEGSYSGFPMVCLVNGGSASGSEIVAAALQDHGRAVIVGERSYGKGSVQTIHQFKPTEGEIKLTTASFWRPNGKNLNKPSTKGTEEEDWGVRPDKDYVLKLDRKEQFELSESLREAEIIPNREAPAKPADEAGKDPKAPFVDKQLQMGLDHLKSQIKTASRVPANKAG